MSLPDFPVSEPTCCRLGCEHPATWQPILILCHPNGEDTCPAILWLGVCAICRPSLGVEDFISDEGWARIVEGMVAAGAAAPSRERTRLDWRRLGAQA